MMMLTCDHCVGVGAAQLGRQQLGPPHHLGAQTLDAVVPPGADTLVLRVGGRLMSDLLLRKQFCHFFLQIHKED